MNVVVPMLGAVYAAFLLAIIPTVVVLAIGLVVCVFFLAYLWKTREVRNG